MQHGWVYKHTSYQIHNSLSLSAESFFFLKLQEPHLFLFAKKTIQQTKLLQKTKEKTQLPFVWVKSGELGKKNKQPLKTKEKN